MLLAQGINHCQLHITKPAFIWSMFILFSWTWSHSNFLFGPTAWTIDSENLLAQFVCKNIPIQLLHSSHGHCSALGSWQNRDPSLRYSSHFNAHCTARKCYVKDDSNLDQTFNQIQGTSDLWEVNNDDLYDSFCIMMSTAPIFIVQWGPRLK